MLGRIDTTSFAGVTVEAYKNTSPNDIAETAFTDADGKFAFTSLDSGAFYKLKFHYQDAIGAQANIFSDYEYTGYKFRVDNIGDIAMPYTMLLQTKQLLDSLHTDAPLQYENKYLLGFVDLTGAIDIVLGNENLTRKRYDLTDFDALINQWRTINQYNNQNKDVIDNLGRVYIGLYITKEVTEDVYKLSKYPAKSLSEMCAAVVDILLAVDGLKNIVVKKFTPNLISTQIAEYEKKLSKELVLAGLKSLELPLKSALIATKDKDAKVIINNCLDGITALGIIVKKSKDGTLEFYKEVIKNFVNNKLFVKLYELHIEQLQFEIGFLYNQAVLLAPPDSTFEFAAHKLIVLSGSFIDSVHQKTDNYISTFDALLLTGDGIKLANAVDKALATKAEIEAQFSPSNKFDILQDMLKTVSGILDLIRAVDYGFTFDYSFYAYLRKGIEQVRGTGMAFNPQIVFPSNRGFARNGDVANRSAADSTAVIEMINTLLLYNAKLDSTISMLQSGNDSSALTIAQELINIDSVLNNQFTPASIRFSAIGGDGENVVAGFGDNYNELFVNYNRSVSSRSGMALSLYSNFLDSTATNLYLDTVVTYATNTKYQNNLVIASLQLMDSISAAIPIPVRAMLTSIVGTNEVDTNALSTTVVSYRNFGTDTAYAAYLNIAIDGGFSILSDSIYIGDLAPDQTGSVSFQITAPPIDTFAVYSITLNIANGEGDIGSEYIITNTPKICVFYADNDDDGYGSSTLLIDTMEICYAPYGYVENNLDCNDENSNAHPGGTEICNGIDDDCNGNVDDFITKIIAVTPNGPQLYIFDYSSIPANWIPQSTLTLTMPGSTIQSALGVAINPLNNRCFALVKISGSSQRRLVTVNTTTGVCSLKGNLGDQFSSLTFSPDGRLFAVTGDGATVPETLYEIDTTTAAKTLKTPLGNGNDGEVIAFNKDDGYIYHWSGTYFFEKIDTTTFTITSIPESGYTHSEVFGAVYTGSGNFLIADINEEAISQTKTGVSIYIADVSDRIRGLGAVLSNAVAPTMPILNASSTVVCNPSAVTLSVSSGVLNNASHWQWYSGSCQGTSVGIGDSIVVTPSVTTTYFVRGEGTCVSPACGSITIHVGCGSTLNLKVFIEGLYISPDSMMAVLDPVNYPTICDSITVELHDTINPFDVISTVTNVISTKGLGQFVFTNLEPRSYYIVVRHHNSVETWSKMPVMIGLNTSYDFTAPE